MHVLMITPELPSPANPNTLAPVWRQIESLRSIGVTVDVIDVKGVPVLKYFTVMKHWPFAKGDVDLIHAHYGLCGWIARTQFKVPVVVSFMGSDLLGAVIDNKGSTPILSHVVMRINRWIFSRTIKTVIVKSQEMADLLSHRKCHVVPNGVDLDLFKPMDRSEARKVLGWEQDKRYVLFPGSHTNPRKGFDFANQVTELASTKLGEPIELITMKKVPPDTIPLYMNACEAELMVSFKEGSPNVVKEAMACNLPVVGVPVGDVEDLLDGVDGCIVRPREVESVADALVSILQGEGHGNGREMLQKKKLDQVSVARRILEIYEEMLAH